MLKLGSYLISKKTKKGITVYKDSIYLFSSKTPERIFKLLSNTAIFSWTTQEKQQIKDYLFSEDDSNE